MKYNYSTSYPQNMCKAVHNSLPLIKFPISSPLNVDISNLSTISSSEYYAVRDNVSRCIAVLSTNPQCLRRLLIC